MSGIGAITFSGHGFSLRGEKNRFVLPPAFRKMVAESSGARTLCLAKHDRWNCLTGFGLSRCDEFAVQLEREEERAIRMGQDFDRDLRSMQLHGFAELSFDASGRFIMPDYLAELGVLGQGVFFHGAGNFFTMWNPQELYRQGAGWEGAQAACRKLEQEAHEKGARK